MRLTGYRGYQGDAGFEAARPRGAEAEEGSGGKTALERLRPLDCMLTDSDRAALQRHRERLAGYGEGIYPRLLDYLDAKLEDALRVRDDAAPRTLATGNSRIVYRLPSGHDETRILVHSTEYIVIGFSLPTATLLGAALLGTVVGQRVPYLTSDGEILHAELRAVPFQPGEFVS